jgi:hypothetical protein
MPLGKELFFQLLSRLGAELPPVEGQNPIASALGSDGYTPDDGPYLRQYMGIPEDGGLLPTDLRPTRLQITDNLPWYRPVVSPIDEIRTKTTKYSIPRTSAISTGNIDTMKAGDVIPLKSPAVPGLGHFTGSIGMGESGRPFLSVYDKWDFDSPVISPLMERMMTTVGKPFHVYERYPLTRQPNGSYKVGGDIELPSK